MTEEIRKRAINKLIPRCPVCKAEQALDLEEKNIIVCTNCNSKWLRTSGITMKLLESENKDLVGKHMEFDDWNKIASGKNKYIIEDPKKGSFTGFKRRFARAYFKNLKKINLVMAVIGLVLGVYFLIQRNYLLSALMFVGMLGYLYGLSNESKRGSRKMTRAERRRRARK
jgi:rRNA processing protein Gar1/DNA-directed RNA polymerase subunit RPC12/RpoP